MKDLSFFLLKNALGAKMKKRYNNFCNGDDCTSTVNPQNIEQCPTYCVSSSSPYLPGVSVTESQPTLEEMIVQLELEEKAARRAKLDEYGEIHHRMSCVNSSDILRTARNALNQYPRFSLDGKDAMYRSSFRCSAASVCKPGRHGSSGKLSKKGSDMEREREREKERDRIRHLPTTVAGESVVWCRPGVVAKLMGLEAMPMPVSGCHRRCRRKAFTKEQHLKRRCDKDKDGIEKTGLLLNRNCGSEMERRMRGSCSKATHYVLKPCGLERPNETVGWPVRRFL